MGVSKNNGFSLEIIHLFIGFGTIFIHHPFWGKNQPPPFLIESTETKPTPDPDPGHSASVVHPGNGSPLDTQKDGLEKGDSFENMAIYLFGMLNSRAVTFHLFLGSG